MDICQEQGADLHMAQLMPLLLPLTVSCFSKIQTGFTFLVPAHPGSPGQRAVKRVCVCVQCQHSKRKGMERGPTQFSVVCQRQTILADTDAVDRSHFELVCDKERQVADGDRVGRSVD